jgi:RNA polymerase sigma-70 factor (ECF subfamily)
MNSDAAARAAMLSTIPDLRAFALSLCGSRDQGDDLVQETLLRAWAHLADFQEGTNMAAWLFTILRNHFVNECRRRRRWVEDVDGQFADRVTTVPGQDGWEISTDLRDALMRLPVHQRDAVILVGAAGMSLEEAASICACEIGTIKSRVHRGRARLAELMAGDPPGFGEAEAETRAPAIRAQQRHRASHGALEAMPH